MVGPVGALVLLGMEAKCVLALPGRYRRISYLLSLVCCDHVRLI